MADANEEFTYDVFISYAHQDATWVRDWLLPGLEKARLRVCIDFRDFEGGVPSLVNMENAVEQSRKTLLVLTPDWVQSQWTAFESLLTQTEDPAGRRARMIPLRLKPCNPPKRIAMLTYLDFSDPAQRDAQLARLVAQIRGKPVRRPPKRKAPDALPPPGDLPPGSHVPIVRNACFTGRVADLQALAHILIAEGGSGASGAGLGQTRAVVPGMGGLGKTTLALEVCYRYGAFFPGGVFWLNATNDGALTADLVACGMRMGPKRLDEPRFAKLPQPEQVETVLRAWTGDDLPRLVVLDNVDDLRLLRAWLPRLQGKGLRLLVTGRRAEWPPELGLASHALGLFSLEECRELWRKLVPRLQGTPDVALDGLAKHLGLLPLAIDLAGHYLGIRKELTAKEYQDDLDKAQAAIGHRSLMGYVRRERAGHEVNVEACFDLSYALLKVEEPEDALARRLFHAAGYLAPNVAIPPPVFASLAQDDAAADQAVQRLADLGLLSPPEAGPVVHPLLAELARAKDQGATQEVVVDALRGLGKEANATGVPRDFAPLRAHVQAAAERAGKTLGATELWNELGWYLRAAGAYEQARDCRLRSLRIDEEALGPDHPDVAAHHSNLGQVLQDLGDLAGAREQIARALEIGLKTLGPDHPTVATRRNNLGSVLQAQGDLPAAWEQIARALEIGLKTLGPDHPTVATLHSNLATALRDLGDLPGAREHIARALEIDLKVRGPEHPVVAIRHSILGLVLKAQGDLAGAREQIARALEIDLKALGPDHPNVATRHNNLGQVLQALGDLAGAREQIARALEIGLKTLGPDHPDVAIWHNNLGGVLQALGDLAGAREQIARALEIDLSALGPDHPTVAIFRRNLAGVERAIAERAERHT